MAKRRPISKKMRFDIFKRDAFTCLYCGRKPPETILEIDHIVPVFEGGTNTMTNLATACFNCNRGKRGTMLQNIPPKLYDELQEKKEKETQLEEYRKYILHHQIRIDADIQKVESIYSESFKEWGFADKFKKTVHRYLVMLPIHEVESAMRIACERMHNEDKALKYFCGVCWSKFDTRNNIT